MWDAASHGLASALGASIGGAELVNYAIRNLGYVSVSENNGSVRVRLRPAAISPIAFSALCYYLMDRKPERIVLSRLERDWSHEFIGADVNVLRVSSISCPSATAIVSATSSASPRASTALRPPIRSRPC